MSRLFPTLREALARFSSDGCAFLAQAVSFNAIFGLFPLVVLGLTGASLLVPDAQSRLLGVITNLSPAVHSYIQANLQSYIFGRGISSLIALGFLLWSGKNLFMALTIALDRILEVPKGRGYLHDMALAIVMLPIIGILIIIAVALPIAISLAATMAHLPDKAHLVQIAAYFISLALVFGICMVLYAFLPNRVLPWHFGVPGATFCAVIWPVLQYAFTEYTININFTRIYGALSVPLALLLWFYLVANLFFFGAEVSAAWALAHGTVKLTPVKDRTS